MPRLRSSLTHSILERTEIPFQTEERWKGMHLGEQKRSMCGYGCMCVFVCVYYVPACWLLCLCARRAWNVHTRMSVVLHVEI